MVRQAPGTCRPGAADMEKDMRNRTLDILDILTAVAAAVTLFRFISSPFWWMRGQLVCSGICLLIMAVSPLRIAARRRTARRDEIRGAAMRRRGQILASLADEDEGDGGNPVLLCWEKDASGALHATASLAGRILTGMIRHDDAHSGWHCLISDVQGRTLFEADARSVEEARRLLADEISQALYNH